MLERAESGKVEFNHRTKFMGATSCVWPDRSGDAGDVRYKRFDEETLRAQVPLADFDLTVLYLWCTSDEGSSGWRLAELLPYDKDMRDDPTWSTSISEANTTSADRILSEAIRDAESAETRRAAAAPVEEDEDDDDDYWAQYDRTPARTPAIKRSPAPQAMTSMTAHTGASEDDYYSQYANVQPAMDANDPGEASTNQEEIAGQSTLNGDTFAHLLQRQNQQHEQQDPQETHRAPFHDDEENEDGILISQPQPSRSPSSTAGSDAVERLEQSAAARSDSEVAVKQHVSTSVKSMYRLARSTGMDREEFKRIVERELEVLELLD